MSKPQSGGVEDVGHVLLEEALAAGVAGVELDHVVAQLLQAKLIIYYDEEETSISLITDKLSLL